MQLQVPGRSVLTAGANADRPHRPAWVMALARVLGSTPVTGMLVAGRFQSLASRSLLAWAFPGGLNLVARQADLTACG